MSDVSIILPVHNASKWLDECLKSISDQTFTGSLELSAYDDASTDDSFDLLEVWRSKLKEKNIQVTLMKNKYGSPKGVGFARNRAVENSCGHFLCFLDADDVMSVERVQIQYNAAFEHPECLIGSRFHREPSDSMKRFTLWANTLNEEQLQTQIFTSHGPTIAMPTWFCSRELFDKVGGFSEDGQGTPEDLIFFYKHLDLKGSVIRVNSDLLMYRYHSSCTTFSVSEETIWNIRLQRFERDILNHLSHFTIWNAGKQGRKFYRSLKPDNRKKVSMFCDVDAKKIKKAVYIYEESQESPKPRVPICHFSKAEPPIVICMKMDLTGGKFEENLNSLHLKENQDYHYFS
ncbi:UDP-GlcNAc:betaGal beta-1,3-N-acetylglucosaminyltransferase-like protein 1 isoform X3 [Octopus sinensis]|uniref:UDP-GlcNAc:betaGal beta-1,3-N-acetylglucosaminyltransferase-like protein 1 isoform X3 n=1 Tax=Octopus sinensis TaxID=2607531 RepID=A0A6P7U010_9MOLL|nr:UDP-GlcNAc:betaGal beta-1,3-N-acetylglucosaminyltransferase-like protein 1 isoform X3 [Octopus sinensis]